MNTIMEGLLAKYSVSYMTDLAVLYTRHVHHQDLTTVQSRLASFDFGSGSESLY
jgi:hypothetical protein